MLRLVYRSEHRLTNQLDMISALEADLRLRTYHIIIDIIKCLAITEENEHLRRAMIRTVF